MKLNPYDIDIQPEELAQLNTPDSFKNSLSYDDVQLSKDLPIVVKYDYIDLDAPEQDYNDPKSIFEYTLKHEMWVTEKINELADVADEEHDRASINFVDQFIDEQVEEEKTVRDILNLFRHRDGHTVATIDDIVGAVKE